MTTERFSDDPTYKLVDSVVRVLKSLRWLWVTCGFIFVAFGFEFKTPSQHFKAIESKQTALAAQVGQSTDELTDRVTAVEQHYGSIERYVYALSVAQCLDRPKRDTQLMGLPCDSLLTHRIP